MYAPLLYHSNYGLGGSSFGSLFEKLNKYNLKNCGIVDKTFFGLPEFVKYSKNYNIKPIIGASILLDVGKLYLFIKNKCGYENLCQILTRKAFGNINIDFIRKHSAGLILLSNSVRLLENLRSVFKEIFYLLLPPPFIPPHLWGKEGWGGKFPPLAAYEIFHVTKQEKVLYKLMCAIKKQPCECKKGIPNHLLTDKEFNKIFTDYPQAIINNKKLSEMCNFIPENRRWIFPASQQDLYHIIKSKMRNLTPEEKSRIQYEYRIITDTGFTPYFSLVYYLKEFALSEGIGMNVRGSAASSFILYLLGLSIVNPLKYNLPFERFLNPQRTEPPDIDVDVEFNQRERLIQEIYKKFGTDYVAHISVINRFQRRARFRDTARAYGISPQELKNLKNHLGENIIKDIHDISRRIDNYPHYFSCHASGIVITPKPIYTFVPLYPSPAGQIIHFDKDGIEMVGLVKIDILGVRGFPSLFLSKDKINFHDPNIFKFISQGNSLGCFQIESPMVRQWLKRIKPKTLMDIANAIAIIRPGPARGGMKEKFLKRLKAEEKIEYPHPQLESALKQTFGIPIYQEQILQIAHDFVRFSLSDADMLRRAMTKERNSPRPFIKGRGSNRMKELENLFFSKAKEMQYSKKETMAVWERIKSFSSFGFNKAHSITYATLAYLSAYQKFYNPSDFFCQVINNKGGYYPTYAYINEVRRWMIKIFPPDINKSTSDFTAHNSSLRTGLGEIKNLSFPTIQRILKSKPFKTIHEFLYYVRPSLDEGLSLIKSGALDTFEHTRPELYFCLLDSKLPTKFAPWLRKNIPKFNDFRENIKLKNQLEAIGFIPNYHILEIFFPQRRIKIAHLPKNKKINIHGLLVARRTILTKNNKLMSFLTIDDETGILEVIIFPNKYNPNSIGPIMEIEGIIKDDSLIAEKYTSLLFNL